MISPFKRRDKTVEFVTVDDGAGNAVEIPKYGCFTPLEAIEISEVKLSFASDSKASFSRLKLAALERFLTLRIARVVKSGDEKFVAGCEVHRYEADGWAVEPWLEPGSLASEMGSAGLLDVAYEWMENEGRSWAAPDCLLTLSGEGAEEAAKDYAEKVGAIAASRPDLRAQKTWQVFKSIDVVPSDYEPAGTPKPDAPAGRSGNIGKKSTGKSG